MRKTFLLSLIGIVILLLLQGIWLFNMYSSYKISWKKDVELLFDQVIEKELSARIFGPNQESVTIKSANNMSSEEKASLKGDTLDLRSMTTNSVGNNQIDALFQYEQDQLMEKNPINLNMMDSLFTAALLSKEMAAPLWIHLIDNQNMILSSVGRSDNHSCIKTAKHPIGTTLTRSVQAGFTSPVNYILEKMKIALIFSFVIVLFISNIIYYMLQKIYQKNRELKQQEENIHQSIHDLKSPLNAFFLWIDSMDESSVNETGKEIIKHGKKRILHLIDQIDFVLENTKNENMAIQKTDINFPDWHKMVWDEAVRLHPGKLCELSTHNPNSITIIKADGVRLERCLLNLFDNAMNYSDSNVHVTLTWSIEDDQLKVSVSDDGWGIDHRYIKKLGRSFFRIQRSEKPTIKGYGIGLNSVKKILHDMNGKLQIESQIGKGSIFTMFIPIK